MKITKKHIDVSPQSVHVTSYVVGFLLSIVLTLGAYILVQQHVAGHHAFLTHKFLVGVILLFAMLQLVVQLVFFLHLGREKKPRWNLQVLMFAALVVSILVAGSIWIMANLDYNMQLNNPKAEDSFIIKDEGFSN